MENGRREKKNWDPLTADDYTKLKAFYYEKKNILGRDRLWYAYRQAHPESQISQRTLLNEFLKKQELWQRTTIAPKKGSIRPIISKEVGNYQIDCMNLSAISYNGYRYIVSAVDILTKRLFAMAIKTQTQQSVVDFLKEMKRLPDIQIKSFHSDNGTEFQGLVQSWATTNEVKWTFGRAGRPEGQGQIERMNHTTKRMLYAAMRIGDKNWPSILPQLVENINNTMSFATKKSPLEVQNAAEEDKERVYDYIKSKKMKSRRGFEPEFQLGDHVRLLIPSESSDIRRRAKIGYFGSELFEVVAKSKKVHEGFVDSYKLKNLQTGGIIKGLFPSTSLRLVPSDTEKYTGDTRPEATEEGHYEIEALIGKRELRRRRNRNQVQYLVLWADYPRSEATYENAEDLPADLVSEYENEHNSNE